MAKHPHVKQVERNGRKVWVIDRVFKRLSDGVRERYRRDAEVQTATAARAEHDRIVAHWLQHGSITALLAAPKKAEPVPEPDKPTASTWDEILTWYRATIAPTLSPSTRNGYDDLFDGPHFVRWQGRPITPEMFSRAAINEWTAEILAKGNGDSSCRNLHIALRSVLRSARENGKIDFAVDFPPLPKVGRKVVEAASQADVDAVLNEDRGKHCGDARWEMRQAARLAFRLAIFAGLRASEIRGLRWPDVDLTKRTLTVRRAVVGGEVDTPKSGHERQIPICESLHAALTEPAVAARRKADRFGLVAPRADGQPWGDTGLLQALRRACKRLGLPRRKVHALRHYFVTALFEGGVPAPEVQRLAGHADLSTTQRYAHTTAERLRQAVSVFDRPRGNGVAMASGDG